MSEHIKQILSLVTEAKNLAEKSVTEDGEQHLQPVFRELVSAEAGLNRRVAAIKSFADEQKATEEKAKADSVKAKADEKAHDKAEVKADKDAKAEARDEKAHPHKGREAKDTLGRLH